MCVCGGTGKVYFFYCGTMQKYFKNILYKLNCKKKHVFCDAF